MKLFIREHLLLMLIQIVQCVLLVSVIWLAGFKDMQLLLYAIFLNLFLLFVYLVYQFWSRRHFYKRMETPLEEMDDVFELEKNKPINIALKQLLLSQDRLYQNQLMNLTKEQDEHKIYMDMWVHQMKTPLSIIDLIARDLDEPHSTNIRDESEQIKNGLDTVLYMARLRGISNDFHIKRLVLGDIVNQVTKDNRRLFIRTQVYPKIVEEVSGMKVDTDEKWLYFILTQIIHNAVKYSAGISNQLDIRLDQEENRPFLEVNDHGIGIPQADLRRIFDAFYTGENGRTYKESTGVGLYVTKRIADYLGHEIEIMSTVREGTIVRLFF